MIRVIINAIEADLVTLHRRLSVVLNTETQTRRMMSSRHDTLAPVAAQTHMRIPLLARRKILTLSANDSVELRGNDHSE